MVEYERGGRVWKFDPLPASVQTARFFLSLKEMGSKRNLGDNMVELLGTLPLCIERAMRRHHSEDEINAFIDTIELNFGEPESLNVIADLNLLFLGTDPKSVADVPDAKPGA